MCVFVPLADVHCMTVWGDVSNSLVDKVKLDPFGGGLRASLLEVFCDCSFLGVFPRSTSRVLCDSDFVSVSVSVALPGACAAWSMRMIIYVPFSSTLKLPELTLAIRDGSIARTLRLFYAAGPVRLAFDAIKNSCGLSTYTCCPASIEGGFRAL